MEKDRMMTRTSQVLVPIAVCAIGLSALVFTGCRREAEKPAPSPTSPEVYMNDKAFMGKLGEERKAQMKLVKARNDIATKMQAMVEAMRAKLKTDDLMKVKAELEKDPEWNRLYVACTNANAKCEANRRATLSTVRERLTPKPISK